MPSRVASQIERGMQLKQQALSLASSWQFDVKSDRFPDFIMGDSHVLGDLELDIERWFNEVRVLTEGLIGGDRRTLFYMYVGQMQRPSGPLRSESTTRTTYLKDITEAFDFGIRELKKIHSWMKTRIAKVSYRHQFLRRRIQRSS